MAQFTQLNLDARSRDTSNANQPTRSGSKPGRAVFLGLLIVTFLSGALLLVLGACSRKAVPATDANSSNQNLSNQPAAALSTMPSSASTVTPATSQPATPRKPARRRPTTVTYTDRTSGISFQYPRKFRLKTGDKVPAESAGAVPMDFVQPGGVTLAAVEVPSGSYPGTDFTSAFFNVSVHRSLTAAECDQFALLSQSEAGPVPPSKVKVGAVEFAEMEDASAQLIKQTDAKYYHMFENGACYEFALGVGTAGDAAEDGSKPVDRDEVFRKLEKILATVKIKSAPVPQVAASGPAQTDTGNKQENQ